MKIDEPETIECPGRPLHRESALAWTSLLLSLLFGCIAAIVVSVEALELSGLHGLAAAALVAIIGPSAWIVTSAIVVVLAARLTHRLRPPRR